RRRHDRRYLSGLQGLATRPDHRFDQDVVRSLRLTSFGSLRLCENCFTPSRKEKKVARRQDERKTVNENKTSKFFSARNAADGARQPPGAQVPQRAYGAR